MINKSICFQIEDKHEIICVILINCAAGFLPQYKNIDVMLYVNGESNNPFSLLIKTNSTNNQISNLTQWLLSCVRLTSESQAVRWH